MSPEPLSVPPPSGDRAAPRLPAWLLAAPPYAVLALVVVAAFARVRLNGPVWDDALLTVENPYLRTWRGFTTLVSTDIWTASAMAEPSRFYRPLPMVSYLVNARIFGDSAASFHAVNVALHAVNACLLFAFLRSRQLARGRMLPLAMALGFALAPIHVEAVAWIAGRFDLLGATLVLSALLANRRDGAKAVASTTALLGLALLCKESFALGAAVVVLDDVLLLRRPLRAGLVKYVAFGLAVVAFLVARKMVGVVSVAALTGTGAWALTESFAFLLVTYARSLVDTRVLDPFRPYAPFGIGVTCAVLGLVVAIGLGLGGWLWRESRTGAWDPRKGAIGMGFAWVLLGFAPVALTGPNLEMVGDRYAYFPLLGVFVAGCALCSRFHDHLVARWAPRTGSPRLMGRVMFGVTLVAVGILGAEAARVHTRLLDWLDERTLFNASLRDDPENAYALYSLGFLEAQEGSFGDAEDHLGRALARKPRAWRTLNALCYVRLHEHRLKSAERFCRDSVEANPDNPRAWVNLASVYVNANDWAAGAEAASRAVERKPRAAEPYFLRAVCLANLGDLEGARADLRAALLADPKHAGALDLLRQFEARGIP